MTTDEAKIILSSYRPTKDDAADSVFASALALTRTDPALRVWYERQQQFDRAMSTEVETSPVPAGLRDSILAAARKPAVSTEPRSRWWMSTRGLALAAGIAATATVAVLFWPRPKVPAVESSIATFAIADAQDPSKHGGRGDEAKALNRALNTPTTHLGDTLPVKFESLHDSGCRTVHVDGRDVLEMCFRRNGVQFHCYIARRRDFPQIAAPNAPLVTNRDGAGLATWSDASNLYIVVSKPGPDPLHKLL